MGSSTGWRGVADPPGVAELHPGRLGQASRASQPSIRLSWRQDAGLYLWHMAWRRMVISSSNTECKITNGGGWGGCLTCEATAHKWMDMWLKNNVQTACGQHPCFMAQRMSSSEQHLPPLFCDDFYYYLTDNIGSIKEKNSFYSICIFSLKYSSPINIYVGK